MPPFWVGFSKQRKKPDWRRSSNCVQNAFFQLSPSGRNGKTPLGSNFTISVSCHHFGWAFPSSGKSRIDEGRPIAFKTSFFQLSPSGRNEKTPLGSNFTISVSCDHFGWAFPSSGKTRIDEGRPIAFKTRFFNFPHRGETKKHPWDRILQFRFHATILGGLFQAAEKAGLTKVVQLRSKRVFSTFPIGAKRKNTLGIEFYNFGFMPPFWVGFSKQRKKPDCRRSSNCVQNAFFQLSPSGRNEKTPLGSNFTISVSCHHFEWAFPSSGKTRIDEGRPIAFKTRFINFPHRGETEKHPWDRILQFRFHATILGGLFQAAEKPGLTKVVQLRSKRVLSTFPIGAKRKNTLGIEFYNFGFMPPFWVGFSKQRKNPDWRRSSNCVQNAFYQLSPSGQNGKTPLGSNFTISVSCHHFGWAFPSSGKTRIDEGRPIAFKTRFFNFPHRGETEKHPWDRILQFRFHATILGGLFQAAEKAGLTKVVQLRSKRVFSTFPIGAKRKNTLGIEFYNFGFMPPFWVGFSKQRKNPEWRRSSNCVQNAFFQLSPSGRNEKTPLGSNFTISVSCHHFEWAFLSSGKTRVDEGRPITIKTRFINFPHRGKTKKHPWDRILQFRFHATILGGLFQAAEKAGLYEGRPIAFKTRFFNFPHRGETKKHLWDRILQFRFHATILGGLFQAAEKAGLTKVVQLRSKRVFSTFPIGAKRKNTLGIEFYNFGFMRPFWVGFSKQRKNPDWRRSSNCVQNAFFQLSPSGRNEKTPLGSNFTISVSCHHFGWAFPSSGKSRIDEGRSIAFKTSFFNFPHRGESKKHPWDRILQFRFHATILGGLFQAAEKAGLTKVVQLRSKRVFSTFPIGAKRKNTLGIKFYNFGFMRPFLVGFSKQRKKPGWTKVDQLRSKRVFSTFPIGAKRKNTLGIEFYNFGFMPPFWVGFSKHRKKPDWRRSFNCVQNAFFQLSPSGRIGKTPLGSNFTISVSCHHFGWAFPSSGKSRVDEVRPITFKTRFFNFPHRGETKKHPWDRILQFRFHATILGGLFQAAEKPGLTKVIQLRWKRVFSTFPIGAKRKNTLGIEFYNFGFMPPFWVGFSKQRKKPDWRRSSNCVQNAFFQLSPSGRNGKTPLGSNFTISVSCHHFGWAFPSSGKSRIDEGGPIAFKTRFCNFPHRGETKKHPWIEFYNFGFMRPFWVGFSKQRKKPDWRRSFNCVKNAFFQLSPSGRNGKTPLGSNFTISVSCHHFGWAFPSSGKSRIDEGRPIAFKTRFFNFPLRGETKKHPWDRILQFRFHATILGGFFEAAEEAGCTKVVQLRSKCVFSTFPIGAKRKNTLGIEFYNFGFMPPFWVGFSKQRKKPGGRSSTNYVQNAFFQLSPSGRNEKHPWDRILQFRFHATILGGLFQAAEKPGLTKVIHCVQNAFFELSPSGRNEKTPLGSNFTISVSCHHFGWAFPSSGKSRIDEGRPIAFKTRFFNFPHRGETEKHPWDRILQFRFHATILGGLFQAAEKAGLTKVVQLRSKRVFSTFPIGAKRKNTLGIEFYNFGFMRPFWVGFSKQRKKPDWRRSFNCVKNAFFQLSPSGRNGKTPLGSNLQFRFHATILGGLFQAAEKAGLTKVVQLRSNAFFNFPLRGETKKHPWDRILQFRFHATILGGFFEAAEEAGCTKVVQLRSKCVFSTFPIGAKRKNTLGIEFYNFGFMPPFWVGFSKQRKKPGGRSSTNYVQNAFFQLSPSGRNEKTPLGSNFTISVSCDHFGWAFPSSGKTRIDESHPIAFKTRFWTFPIGAKRKNTLGIEFYNFGFMPPFWVGFSKQRKKPDWRRSSNCVQNAFFQLSPSGRNGKTPLGSNFTISVSCHHFGWAFPSSGKAGLTKVVQLRSKRVFSTFPIGAKRKNTLGIEFYNFGFMPPFWVGFSKQRKKPDWRRSFNYVKNAFFQLSPSGRNGKTPLGSNLQFRFHATILGGLFQAAEKAGLTKVVQLRSKRVFSTFAIGAKRKNTLGIEFYNFVFMPPFWVGFSKQRKKPDVRRSSNCVQNAFFQLSPSGRNGKTPLGSNFTISVSCDHFGWAFPSSGKTRIDESHPIALKTRFFNFPHLGETKKHPWDQILQFRFHATILGGLFQAAEKAGWTKVDQLRSKRVFSTFPIGAKRKNTLGIEFYNFGFMPPFWVGFSKQRKKAGLTKVVQLRSKRVFSTFPIGAKRKNTLGIEFYNFGFMPPFWVGFSKQRKNPDWRRSSNCVQNAFF